MLYKTFSLSTPPHSHPGGIVMVPMYAEYGDGDVKVLILVVHPREPVKSNTCHISGPHEHMGEEEAHGLCRTCCSRSWRPDRWWSRTGLVYRPCSTSSSPPCSCAELYVMACCHGRDLHPAAPGPPDTQGARCQCMCVCKIKNCLTVEMKTILSW